MRAMKTKKFDFSSWTAAQRRAFTLFALLMVLLLALAFAAGFFLFLKGPEKVMVPDVRNMDLADALVDMQERELYPRVALRFTNNPQDKNTILDQNPPPGSIVKAGRRIKITVSKGAVLDRIEEYVGQDLEQVKLRLLTLFSASRPLLTVREPPMYRFDDSPAGTILEQKPLPNTEISGPAVLEFIVSKGPESAKAPAPDFLGKTMAEAISLAEKSPMPVNFSMRQAKAGEAAGKVAEQKPVPGTEIKVQDRMDVTVAAPAASEGTVNGIFMYKLTEYPYPVPVKLEAVRPNGQRIALASLRHPGGNFSLPFSLPSGTTLVLSVLDREVSRTEVGAK